MTFQLIHHPVMRQKFPLPRNPMAPLFQRAAESLTTSLTADSEHYYQRTGHHFLNYLDAQHPRVRSLRQLRRDPHILDWLNLLRSHQPPLAKVTYAHYVIRLRRIFEELAWTKGIPLLTRLIRSDDIPSADRCLPRPLTSEQDRLIQQELLRRDDLVGNALLLLRHTGMRIGECLDLPLDCLRHISHDQWAVHVPLGKLRTERLVPVDSFVCGIVHRLRLLCHPDKNRAARFLLPRPQGRMTLGCQLRRSLHQIAAAVGIKSRIVPHQFRHYATSRTMPRSASTRRSRACGPLHSSHGPVNVMRHSPVASLRARCGSKTGVVRRYRAPKLFLPKAGSPFVPSRSVVQVCRQYQRRPSGHGVWFGNYASSPQSKAPQIAACAFREA